MQVIEAVKKPKVQKYLKISFEEILELKEKYLFISISDVDIKNQNSGYITSDNENVLMKIF